MYDDIFCEEDPSKIYHTRYNIPIKKVNYYDYFEGEKEFVKGLLDL